MARTTSTIASFLSLLAIAACDASFLHSVETRRDATDRGCPAPNDGAHDVALTLEANGSISVAWTTRATNADSFLVERQSSREPTWGEIGSVGTTGFNDNRVLLDEEYGYRISAVRAAGGSTCTTPASEPATLRTIPRAAGDFDAAGTGVGQITVSWTDVNTFEDGYRVTRTDSGGAKSVLPDIAANATRLADSTVTPGGTYTYEIVAFNLSGVSTAVSDAQRAVTPPVLAWTTPPVIGPQCTLEAFGIATYEAGSSFGSAKGVIEDTDVAGSSTGFSGQIAASTIGPIATAWVVDDSAGGQSALSRTLAVVQTPTTRSTIHRKLPGDDQVVGEGLQALQPECAECGTTPLVSVATGAASTCAVTAAGHVSCWGANGSHQLGHGDVGFAYRAVRPCADGSRSCSGTPLTVTTLDVGNDTVCGITSDNYGLCWGSGYQNGLGRDSEDNSAQPVQICAAGTGNSCTTPLANISQISTGTHGSCAIANGEVWCWGRDLFAPGSFHPPQPVCDSGTLPCTHFQARQVDVGVESACAVKANNEVWCWGQTDSLIFGTDPAVSSQVPRKVCTSGSGAGCPALGGVDEVAVGDDFACARKSGQLYCWGNNYDGQLANGSSGNSATVPTPACIDDACVGELAGVLSFDIGDRHVCALVNGGNLYCWGTNGSGQVGPVSGDVLSAQQICDGTYSPTCTHITGVAAVATGASSSCFAFVDGRVSCMGSTSASGNEEYAPAEGVPFPVCKNGAGADCTRMTGATQLALGDASACAIADGTVTCWGSNGKGQLAVSGGGDDDASEVLVGAGIDAAPLTGVRLVELADDYACALKNDGSVWCWGQNYSGVMGLSTSAYGGSYGFAQPVCVSGTGDACVRFDNVVSLSTGYQHACAVTAAGEAYCWGSQDCGELGQNETDACDGSYLTSPQPRKVLSPDGTTPLGNLAEVGVGYKFSCVLGRDGGVSCFGINENGQLGHGFTDPSFPLPVPVVDRTSGNSVNITDRTALRVGPNDGCALGADGGVVCWGADSCGSLGNPQLATNCNGTFRTDARPVCAGPGPCVPLLGVIDIAVGIAHMCALKTDGSVACWGYAADGELGRGTDTGYDAPIGVALACTGVCNTPCSTPLTGLVSIASHRYHTCGVREDGTVYCWGSNSNRQTGSAHPADASVCSAQVSCASGDGATCAANDVGDVRVCNALSVVAP